MTQESRVFVDVLRASKLNKRFKTHQPVKKTNWRGAYLFTYNRTMSNTHEASKLQISSV